MARLRHSLQPRAHSQAAAFEKNFAAESRLGKPVARVDRKVGNYVWPRRVSRADVADFMLKQLNDDSYIVTAPGICY